MATPASWFMGVAQASKSIAAATAIAAMPTPTPTEDTHPSDCCRTNVFSRSGHSDDLE